MAEWITSVPVWWANVLTLVLFVGVAIGAFMVSRTSFMDDAPDQSRWRDIRWWALGLVTAQLGIYALFS